MVTPLESRRMFLLEETEVPVLAEPEDLLGMISSPPPRMVSVPASSVVPVE